MKIDPKMKDKKGNMKYELGLRGHLIRQTIKQISLFGQIAQWLECAHGKHEVVGLKSQSGQFSIWN